MEEYLQVINLDLSDSLTAAPAMLGYKLVMNSPKGKTSGYIVETEAYHMNDAASHGYVGLTKRNNSLFEDKGTIYVYFTYGMHWCVNIVTGEKGSGQAVLIRAIEPVDGIDLMKDRRKTSKLKDLTSGPAKLTQAMGINKVQDGIKLTDGIISLEPGIKPKKIIVTPRIGITKAINLPWRFYIEANKYVSHINKKFV
jgi:DNA-3-methyladenine glycosylase